jgi:hypothetical protein
VKALIEVRRICEVLKVNGGGRLDVPAEVVPQVRMAHEELLSGVGLGKRKCRCGGVCGVLAEYWAYEARDGTSISLPKF